MRRTTKSRQGRLYRQYVEPLGPWKTKLAISRLAKFRVPMGAWDDVMQELAIEIVGFEFDPDQAGRASEKTILCRRLDNRMRMLARGDARYAALQQRAMVQQANHRLCEEAPEAGLERGDVRRVVAALTPLQQQICSLLMAGCGVIETAQRTGKHYTTIRRHIEKIRDVLVAYGLGEGER